jgi:replicative DNA helicase
MADFFSKDSESILLSAMTYSEEVLGFCCESLKPEDFYFSENCIIFKELESFYKEHISPDLHKLITSLKGKEKLALAGGIPGVTESVGKFLNVTTSDDAEFYIKNLKDLATLRQIQAFNDILSRKLQVCNEKQAEDLIEFCQKESDSFFSAKFGEMAQPIGEVAKQVEKEIMDDYESLKSCGSITSKMGIPSGYKKLDELLGGLRNSHLIVLCARTGIGKTAFAVNLMKNCAMNGKSVVFFSLEMKASEIVRRLISCMSETPLSINLDSVGKIEIKAIHKAVEKISNMTIICEDKAGMKINEIVSKARRYKDKYKTDIIFIDYLQFIRGIKADHRHLEIAEYTRLLKTLAKEIDVPIVVLAQLARRTEDRTNNRIFLSDLRESGSIEQDSDAVIAISRRDYYDPYDKPGMAQIDILKNRHGPCGGLELEFKAGIGKFIEPV